MKKRAKKLVIAEETVRELDGARVEQARGSYGDPHYSQQGGLHYYRHLHESEDAPGPLYLERAEERGEAPPLPRCSLPPPGLSWGTDPTLNRAIPARDRHVPGLRRLRPGLPGCGSSLRSATLLVTVAGEARAFNPRPVRRARS